MQAEAKGPGRAQWVPLNGLPKLKAKRWFRAGRGPAERGHELGSARPYQADGQEGVEDEARLDPPRFHVDEVEARTPGEVVELLLGNPERRPALVAPGDVGGEAAARAS